MSDPSTAALAEKIRQGLSDGRDPGAALAQRAEEVRASSSFTRARVEQEMEQAKAMPSSVIVMEREEARAKIDRTQKVRTQLEAMRTVKIEELREKCEAAVLALEDTIRERRKEITLLEADVRDWHARTDKQVLEVGDKMDRELSAADRIIASAEAFLSAAADPVALKLGEDIPEKLTPLSDLTGADTVKAV